MLCIKKRYNKAGNARIIHYPFEGRLGIGRLFVLELEHALVLGTLQGLHRDNADVLFRRLFNDVLLLRLVQLVD